MVEQTVIVTPVARIVAGDIHNAQECVTYLNGVKTPKVYGSGPKAGQPRDPEFQFKLAVPKTPGKGWKQEDWGAQILARGQADMPNNHTSPRFSWKIEDGDSIEMDRGGKKRYCDHEGYAGCWIIRSESMFAPKLWNSAGTRELEDRSQVKIGHYVRAILNVKGNKSTQSPGVFMKATDLAYVAAGPEIRYEGGTDAATVAGAFGGAPVALPPGAIAVAAAQAGNPFATPVAPVVVPPPAAPVAPVVVPPPVPSFLTPAPAAPVLRPTERVPAGVTLNKFIEQGWTEEMLISQGYAIRS